MNCESKDFMLDYLVSLLDDAEDFSWEAAMQYFCVVWSQGRFQIILRLKK